MHERITFNQYLLHVLTSFFVSSTLHPLLINSNTASVPDSAPTRNSITPHFFISSHISGSYIFNCLVLPFRNSNLIGIFLSTIPWNISLALLLFVKNRLSSIRIFFIPYILDNHSKSSSTLPEERPFQTFWLILISKQKAHSKKHPLLLIYSTVLSSTRSLFKILSLTSS